MAFAFFVPGIPVAKGSARAFYAPKQKRAFARQDNAEKQRPWVSAIIDAATKANVLMLNGPVEVRIGFYLPRPKSHYGSKGDLKPGMPLYCPKRPDLDKLERCVLDALTGIAWADDCQVALVRTFKIYGNKPGADIFLEGFADDF